MTIRTEDRQTWSFDVTNAAMAYGNEISNSFSLFEGEIDAEKAKSWFVNLLPEGSSRVRLVNTLGISDNDFALLNRIGYDCAGALQVVAEYPPPEPPLMPRLPITPAQLEVWSEEGSKLELNTVVESEARMSLAGAQKKWAVIKEKGEYFMPASDEASTHIIKATDNHNIIIYELFLMTVAQLVGLDVPECRLETRGKGLFYCVDRYDRVITDGGVSRIHQEDFCQALGYRPANKYQKDRGPSLRNITVLVEERMVGIPLLTKQKIIDWQVFNVLTGNCDAHAKNLAIIRRDHGWDLAPFYDLVSIAALQVYKHELAFAVGENYAPQEIRLKDWVALASDIDVNAGVILKSLNDMAGKLDSVIASDALKKLLIERGLVESKHPRLEQVVLLIRKQIKHVRQTLADASP